MATQERFEIEIESRPVRGTLSLPKPDNGRNAPAGVLICSDLPNSGDAGESGFLAGLTEALCNEGIAVAQYQTRQAEAGGPELAKSVVDDASAVFRWLFMRDDIDADRIGVFARRIGSIVAANLAGRTDQINRLCLLTPISAEEVVTRATRPNDGPALYDAGSLPESFVTSLIDLQPAQAIASHDRPTLILNGAADATIRPEAATPYLDAVELAGHSLEYELIAMGDHDFSWEQARTLCHARVARFFAAMKDRGAGGRKV